MARSKGRRGRGGNGDNSIAGSMKSLFSGLAMVGVVLAMLLFVCYMLEEKTIDQFIDINDYANETVCSTPCTNIRSGFDTAEDLIILGLGLLGLIAIILVFVGFLLPVIQRAI